LVNSCETKGSWSCSVLDPLFLCVDKDCSKFSGKKQLLQNSEATQMVPKHSLLSKNSCPAKKEKEKENLPHAYEAVLSNMFNFVRKTRKTT